MSTLRQLTLSVIALLTLSLGISACGSKSQSSQEATKNGLMSEQPQKSPEEIIKEKADDLLGDAALAVRKFAHQTVFSGFLGGLAFAPTGGNAQRQGQEGDGCECELF